MSRFRLTVYILMILTVIGCRRHDRQTSLYESFGQEVADVLERGHIDSAMMIIETHKRLALEAQDSDAFYGALTQQAIASYYGGRQTELLRELDSIDRYLARVPRTPLRSLLQGKVHSSRAGYYTRFTYNPDSNIYYYKQAIKEFAGLHDPATQSDAYFNLAGAYRNNGNYDLSAFWFGRAIQVADSADLSDRYRVPQYIGLASNYTELLDFDQSRRWWDRAAEYLPVMSADDRFHYLNNRGHDYFVQKKYPESLQLFLQLDTFLTDRPELEWERNFCRANLTDLYLHSGQDVKADSLLKLTEDYFTNVQPSEYVQEHLRTQRLQLENMRGHYGNVSAMLADWKSRNASLRPEQVHERLEFVRDYYAATGQWQKALDAMTQYTQYEDSIRNYALRMSASERQMRFERDSRLMAMTKDLEMHKKLLTRDYVVGAISLVVIVLLVIVMVQMRRMARHREERMLHRIMDLRLEALRARINPHFIYNILNHEIARREQGLPSHLDALVRLLRRQSVIVSEVYVSLAEDLSFVDDYVSLESDRVSVPVSYNKHIAPDIDPEKVFLPSMVLMIFVENAFKHGFASLPESDPRILDINVRRANGCYVIDVLNNTAPDASPSCDSTRQGLKIVANLLQIINEKKRVQIRFDIQPCTLDNGLPGYRASLFIPTDFNFNIHG